MIAIYCKLIQYIKGPHNNTNDCYILQVNIVSGSHNPIYMERSTYLYIERQKDMISNDVHRVIGDASTLFSYKGLKCMAINQFIIYK